MLPYKQIHIENYEKIQSNLLLIANELFTDFFTTWAVQVQFELLNIKCPELVKYFEQNNLHFDIGRIFVTQPYSSIDIHVDGNDEHPKFLALNLPIAGCKNAPMHWWGNVELIDSQSFPQYGNNIKFYDAPDKILSHSCNIKEPTLVRVDLPHNVDNFNGTPRIVMSIRFNPEPLHLWY